MVHTIVLESVYNV